MNDHDRYYQGVTDLQETEDVQTANTLLESGWELIAVKERTHPVEEDGKLVPVTQPVYIFARTGAGPAERADPGRFDKLGWRSTSKGFDWTFNTTREGAQVNETDELAKAIQAANGKLAIGGFVYTMSKDGKFIQRRRQK